MSSNEPLKQWNCHECIYYKNTFGDYCNFMAHDLVETKGCTNFVQLSVYSGETYDWGAETEFREIRNK